MPAPHHNLPPPPPPPPPPPQPPLQSSPTSQPPLIQPSSGSAQNPHFPLPSFLHPSNTRNPDLIIQYVHERAAAQYTVAKKRKQWDLSHKVNAAKRTGDPAAVKVIKKKVDNHASSVASRAKQDSLVRLFEISLRNSMSESSRTSEALVHQASVSGRLQNQLRQCENQLLVLSRKVVQLQRENYVLRATADFLPDPSSSSSPTPLSTSTPQPTPTFTRPHPSPHIMSHLQPPLHSPPRHVHAPSNSHTRSQPPPRLPLQAQSHPKPEAHELPQKYPCTQSQMQSQPRRQLRTLPPSGHSHPQLQMQSQASASTSAPTEPTPVQVHLQEQPYEQQQHVQQQHLQQQHVQQHYVQQHTEQRVHPHAHLEHPLVHLNETARVSGRKQEQAQVQTHEYEGSYDGSFAGAYAVGTLSEVGGGAVSSEINSTVPNESLLAGEAGWIPVPETFSMDTHVSTESPIMGSSGGDEWNNAESLSSQHIESQSQSRHVNELQQSMHDGHDVVDIGDGVGESVLDDDAGENEGESNVGESAFDMLLSGEMESIGDVNKLNTIAFEPLQTSVISRRQETLHEQLMADQVLADKEQTFNPVA